MTSSMPDETRAQLDFSSLPNPEARTHTDEVHIQH